MNEETLLVQEAGNLEAMVDADGGARLSDADLEQMLALMKESDSIELKLTIPEDSHRSTIDALEIDPLNANIRQVYFLDTPDLLLNAAGLVVRARRIQGKLADTVVKLRPVMPADLPRDLRRSPNFVVEVDATRSGFVCSGSLKGTTENDRVRRAVHGELALRKLFTKEQRLLYRDVAPEGVELEKLTVWGPIFVLKTKWVPPKSLSAMVAEMWLYPDGSRVLELSTKCLPSEGFQVAAETRAFLSHRGVGLTGVQETKTKKALSFFTNGLAVA